MIRIVDTYILRQVVKPLAGAMAIGLLVLLAERMVRLLDTVLGKKNSFAVVFELLAYLVPHYLGSCCPGRAIPRFALWFQQAIQGQRDSMPSWRLASASAD